MKQKLKKALKIFFVAVALLVFGGPSQAYVLQGRHILDLMIENLGEAQSLFVTHKLIFYNIEPTVNESRSASDEGFESSANVPDELHGEQLLENNAYSASHETLAFEETLRFVFSQSFRSELKASGSERIHVFDGSEDLTIVDGYIVPASANRFDPYKDLLLYRSREALVERLLNLGVDIFVSSLGRFEDRIVFVVGANYPDESVSQIWIDQETFLPVRWIIKGAGEAADSDTLEVRYLLWWKIGDIRYPSRIEFYQDDDLVRESQAKNFEANANFSNDLFDIQRLKMDYPQAPEQPIIPGEPEEPSEVQKTIDEFKRVFE